MKRLQKMSPHLPGHVTFNDIFIKLKKIKKSSKKNLKKKYKNFNFFRFSLFFYFSFHFIHFLVAAHYARDPQINGKSYLNLSQYLSALF